MHRSILLVSTWLAAVAFAPGASASDAVAAAEPPAPVTSPEPVDDGSVPGPSGDHVATAPAPETASPPAADTAEAAAEAADEAEIQQEVRAESDELEAVRAAEERARLTDRASPDDAAGHAAAHLGLESPLRQRLRDAFGRESAPVPGSTEPGGHIPGLPEIDHDLRRLQAEYDIPIEVNDEVVAYVRFFQKLPLVRKHFVKWLGRSFKYIPAFRRILREEGLPEDTVYLAMIESGFGNLATSRAKAVGPWQFIAETGRRMGLRQDFWTDERRDPEKAARAASRYLKELYHQTGDWRLAWAGYNAGVGKIYQAQRRGQRDFWEMTRGRVLKAETKGYVPKLMAAAIISKHYEAFGFSREEVVPERWQSYEEVSIPQATPLSVIAKAADVDEHELLELNPELRRTCTPPRAYQIKVPSGRAAVFARNWPSVSAAAGKLAFAQHQVRPGESLRVVAKAYHVDQSTIARMNGLRPGRHVKAGTVLVVPLNALARSQGVAFASAEAASAPERSSKKTRHRAVRSRSVALASSTPRATKVATVGRLRSTVHVRTGDTLWGIAQRFGVAVEELCRWNGIRNPRRFKLQAGRALIVYQRRNAAAEADGAGKARAG